MSPSLSVIIVNWNTRELLQGCLASVFREIAPPPLEVFVVDNGSTDGSAAMVRERFPAVRLVASPVNLGFARANNLALREARGDYLLLLNSDTVLLPGAVGAALGRLEADRRAALAGASLEDPDGTRQNSIAAFPSLATELLPKGLLRRLFPARFPGKERDYPGPLDVDSVVGACMFVRRAAMEQVGPLDEDYFFYLEETDWCLRFRKAGWKVVHVPAARVLHLQGQSVRRVNARARIEYYRSRYLYFRKHHRYATRALLAAGLLLKAALGLALNLAALVLSLGLACRPRRRAGLYARVLLWHLAGRPLAWGLPRP